MVLPSINSDTFRYMVTQDIVGLGIMKLPLSLDAVETGSFRKTTTQLRHVFQAAVNLQCMLLFVFVRLK